MSSILVVAAWLFVLTHIDTFLVIGAFCADPDYRSWEVLTGHYLGFTLGLLAAVAGSVLAAELFAEWTFLLGVVPLSLGLWGLLARPPEATIEEVEIVPNVAGRIGVVTVAGIGLSGENIAVFVPFFVERTTGELGAIVGLYLGGAAVVFLAAFLAARLLESRLASTTVFRKIDRWLVPVVLVVVGVWVIVSGLVV